MDACGVQILTVQWFPPACNDGKSGDAARDNAPLSEQAGWAMTSALSRAPSTLSRRGARLALTHPVL